MATINVQYGGAEYAINVGENTQAAINAAALSEASKVAAEDVLAEVAQEGAEQTLAISNAAAAAGAIAGLYADALSTGELEIEFESVGAVNQANLTANVGVMQTCLVNGTHVFTGDVIRAMRWSWACATGTATVEVTVWKRNVAGATGAGTLNNAAPIATHDVLVGTFTATPAALGITPGTSNPAATAIFTLSASFTIEAGCDYVFRFRNLDASSVVVNCGFMYFDVAAGTQRRAGFQALTATPTTFTNLTTARSPAITLFRARQRTTLPATDAILRTLIDQRDAETLAAMNQRNIDNLLVNAAVYPNTLAVPANYWGDSMTFDAIGTGDPGTGFKGTDIVDGLTRSSVSATVSRTNNSPTLTVTAGTPPTVGMMIIGAGIPDYTSVINVVGNTVTISANASGTATGVPVVASWVKNYGLNGRTSPQLVTVVSAASAGDKAGLNQIVIGSNDYGAATTAAQTLTNIDTCAAAFTNTNFVVAAGWTSGTIANVTSARKAFDVRRGLRTTYGAKALDMHAMFARFGPLASDWLAARRGAVPTGLTQDNYHQNKAGGLVKGYCWAAHTIARNGGAPFVHDDMFGFKAGDGAGTAIGTVRTLGTAFNYQIIAGNADRAVQIDRATGAITRTAETTLQPYRELFVEAGNNKGLGWNGRVILVQQMDGTRANRGVQVRGNGASFINTPSAPAITDGKELTIVICARLDAARTSGQIISTVGSFFAGQQANGAIQFAGRASNGATSVGNVSVTAQSPSDWNFYFFTIKTDGAICAGVANEGATVTATPTADATVFTSLISGFFTNSGDTSPFIGGVKMIWIANSYLDITSAAVRDDFYNPATREPLDLGAGGVVAGVTPLYYLRGRAGDYMLGKNYGSVGDCHAPVPIGRGHLGFVDID